MTCKSFVLYDQAGTQNVTKNALARKVDPVCHKFDGHSVFSASGRDWMCDE
jgi:hypothetical protein